MSAAARRELFVYWRAAAAAGDVRAAATALQTALRAAHPGLQARLLRRGDAAAGGVDTWMEIYALPVSPGGIDAALQMAIDGAAAAALAGLIDGARHVEAFEVVSGV